MKAPITGKVQVANFSTANDYTVAPVVSVANYRGSIIGSAWNDDFSAVVLTARFEGNGEAFCSDGKTPVDGREVDKKLKLPLLGDDKIPSKMKKYDTIHDQRVAFLARSAKALGVEDLTHEYCQTLVSEGTLLGTDVMIDVEVFTPDGDDPMNWAREMTKI